MRTTVDCDAVHRFWLEEADGRLLTPARRQQLDAHLSSCSECRLEHEVLATVAHDPVDGPAPPLDDLSRRRLIDAVLQEAEARDERRARETAPAGRRLVRTALAGVFLLVTVAAITAAFVVGQRDDAISTVEEASSSAPTSIQLLLVSGDSPVESTVAEIGEAVGDRREWAVGEGQLALCVDQDVVLFLRPHSRIRIGRDDEGRVTADLVQGEVTVHKEPSHEGPGFVVTTPAGKIVVTGTRFSVSVTRDEAFVRVYEGAVRVEEAGVSPREISAGKSSKLGSSSVRALDEPEHRNGTDLQATMDLLALSSPSVIELQSTPPGAAVRVDGTLLGHTPVRAAVVAGQRDLELTLPGFEPRRESVMLWVGETTSLRLGLAEHLVGVEVTAMSPGLSPEPAAERPSQPTQDSPSAFPSVPSEDEAAQTLVEAQGLREQQRWMAAAAAYEELIRAHPSSTEARVAQVSLGTIQLDHLGMPESALDAFDGYMASDPGGTLAEEAAMGRALALRAMDRREEAIAAFECFLVDHPTSISAPLANEQLEELR